jgi:hypothetical protein
MGRCEFCQAEMLTATSCTTSTAGRRPYGSERGRTELGIPFQARCPDCGVCLGGFHHRNCDQEQCPDCDGQAISCPCDPSRWPRRV